MKRIGLAIFLMYTGLTIAQESYLLSPESTLTIDGTSTVHDWAVVANKMSGTLTVLDKAPKEITFEVSVADIQSERGPTMDKKMHAALKKDAHSEITFALKEVNENGILVGTLNIAGVAKEVEIQTEKNHLNSGLQLKGEKKITLQDFGMEPPTAMFGQIIVGDEVTVKFDLVFKQ